LNDLNLTVQCPVEPHPPVQTADGLYRNAPALLDPALLDPV
jgi:hypothetical protein